MAFLTAFSEKMSFFGEKIEHFFKNFQNRKNIRRNLRKICKIFQKPGQSELRHCSPTLKVEKWHFQNAATDFFKQKYFDIFSITHLQEKLVKFL
jgi:hypothetical protein